MSFVGILPEIMLLFGQLVIQLLWYILKQLFISVLVKVMDIYRAAKPQDRSHRKYSGQHNQWYIRASHDGNTQRFSCILIGCIFFGIVYLMIDEQNTSISSPGYTLTTLL